MLGPSLRMRKKLEYPPPPPPLEYEMPHNMALYQGLHCLLKLKGSSDKTLQFYLEIVTCDRLSYTMDHSKFIASIQKDKFICALRVLLIVNYKCTCI